MASAAQAASDPKPAPRDWRVRMPLLLAGLCTIYAALVITLCLLLHLASDRWWVATLILYGPRWPWALPLGVLVPAAVVCRRRLLAPLAVVAGVLVVPFMGLCLPWGTLSSRSCPGSTLRVLTCNVHHSNQAPAAIGGLIAATQPDVVALQACPESQAAPFLPAGDWHVCTDGQLYLASRYPIQVEEWLDDVDFKGRDSAAARYEIARPEDTLRLVSLHLDSPRDGLEEVIASHGRNAELLEVNSDLRRRQSQKLRHWLDAWPDPLVIVGDFNTPTESTIYQDYWSDYANAFSRVGFGFGPTHFTRHTAVRIDHILAGPGWQCRRCWVGPPVGSPHRPVFADLCRSATSD
jgi:endonuclease/exonuclease/phosphatase (EEP) superfamily protein YafD